MKTLLIAAALAVASIVPAQAGEYIRTMTVEEMAHAQCMGLINLMTATASGTLKNVEGFPAQQNCMAVGYYTWQGIEEATAAISNIDWTDLTCPEIQRKLERASMTNALRAFHQARKAAGFTD